MKKNNSTGHADMRSSALAKLYVILARKNISLISLFSTVIITVIILKIDAELAGLGGKGAFYLQTAFTRNNFMSVLSSWRSGGVDLLLESLWLNYVYAASYAVLFASAQAYFSAARKNGFPEPIRISDLIVFVLPFAAAFLDWIVITLLYALFSGGYLNEKLVFVFSVTASAKWALIVICLIMILRSYFLFRKKMKFSARQD